MSWQSEEHFDDPALKAALKRSVGQEGAPPALRQQLVALLQAAPAQLADTATGRSPRSNFLNRPLGPRALSGIAALVAVGIAIWVKLVVFPSASPRPKLELSSDLVAAMVARHDQSVAEPDHQVDAAVLNVVAIRHDLMNKLHRTVWVSDLSSDGWKFKGATVNTVNGAQAADVLYVKGDETLSILSLPSPSCDPYEQDYQVMANNNHPIAGFAVADGLFCIVGSSAHGELKMPEVAKLRDHFRTDVFAAIQSPVPAATAPH